MRLATLRDGDATVAVRVDGRDAVAIPGFADVGALLARPGWREIAGLADGARRPVGQIVPADWAPVVPRPGKIICVGLNYRTHILEMGRELPRHPTLFAKFAEALIGPYDPIRLPPSAPDHVDWEGELAIVLGDDARQVDEAAAGSRIAGFTILNDVTMRDYQYRTPEWFQGKTFEGTTPFGPVLVTPDEWTPGCDGAELRTIVDAEEVQRTSTDDLVFGPAALVAYISEILTLRPGDVIATGTPGGVGHARTPARYLRAGETLITGIDGIGELRNRILATR